MSSSDSDSDDGWPKPSGLGRKRDSAEAPSTPEPEPRVEPISLLPAEPETQAEAIELEGAPGPEPEPAEPESVPELEPTAPESEPEPEPAPAPRLILAIDTALGACSVAVFHAPTDHTLASESLEMGRGHAEALLPMVDRTLRAAGVEFEMLDRIVTTVGPGSFTGLRVGIAAARGLALVCRKPVVGVSTLAALTAPHVKEDESVPVVAAIDARHDNFYLQMVGAGGRLLIAPRVASLAETLRAVAIGLVRIAGSGANLIVSHWPSLDVPAPLLVDARAAPDITWVARVGAGLDPKKAPPRPLYLRSPDARPQDAHRLPRR